MKKVIDIVFSVILVFVAPAIAALAFVRFSEGDFLARIASLGLLTTAVLVFGIGCMGLSRMGIFFRDKRNQGT